MINTVFNIADKTIGYVKQWQQLKSSKEALLRSLFFEVQSNLEVFKALNDNSITNEQFHQEGTRMIFQMLDTSVSEAILFGAESPKEYRNFKYLQKKRDIIFQDEKKKKQITEYKSLTEIMYFIVKKTKALRNLSTIDKDLLKKLRINIRMSNISNHLKIIESVLLEEDALNHLYVKRSKKEKQ